MDQNVYYFYLLLVCTGLTYVLTRGFIVLSKRWNVLSQQDFRRKKQVRVPQLGGAAIVLTLLAAAIYLENEFLMTLLIVTIPIVVTGVVDDFFEISARFKLVGQLSSGILLYHLATSHEGFLFRLMPNQLLILLGTVFTVALVVNAFNFIDGVDGLAISYSILSVIGLTIVGQFPLETMIPIVGAFLGFWLLNKPQARIYLGDAGSGFIGALMAYHLLLGDSSDGSWRMIFSSALILAFPLADISLTVFRRLLSGRSPFKGDHDHIHHKLMKTGLTENQVSMVVCIAGGLCVAMGYIVAHSQDVFISILALISISFFLSSQLVGLYYLEHKLSTQISSYGRSLINKYLSPVSEIFFDPNHFYAVVVDLLPYYKELQSKGFPQVNSFVADFSEEFADKIGAEQRFAIGSYTIGFLYENNDHWSLDRRTDVIGLFKDLTVKYQIVKSLSDVPEGMYFYTSSRSKKFTDLVENIYHPRPPDSSRPKAG